jgi:anti-sigma factor RsiW
VTNRIPSELTCQTLVELVTDYLEERLTEEERSRFEQHLVYCTGCAVYLEQMRGAARAASEPAQIELPSELEQRLLAAFEDWNRGH